METPVASIPKVQPKKKITRGPKVGLPSCVSTSPAPPLQPVVEVKPIEISEEVAAAVVAAETGTAPVVRRYKKVFVTPTPVTAELDAEGYPTCCTRHRNAAVLEKTGFEPVPPPRNRKAGRPRLELCPLEENLRRELAKQKARENYVRAKTRVVESAKAIVGDISDPEQAVEILKQADAPPEMHSAILRSSKYHSFLNFRKNPKEYERVLQKAKDKLAFLEECKRRIDAGENGDIWIAEHQKSKVAKSIIGGGSK